MKEGPGIGWSKFAHILRILIMQEVILMSPLFKSDSLQNIKASINYTNIVTRKILAARELEIMFKLFLKRIYIISYSK